MAELRWILLSLGLVLIAYVYWRGRREAGRREASRSPRVEPTPGPVPDLEDLAGSLTPVRREPALGEAEAAEALPAGEIADAQASRALDEPVSERLQSSAYREAQQSRARRKPAAHPAEEPPARASAAPEQRQRFVVLKIVRKDAQWLDGAAVLEALLDSGLVHGEFNIFHRYAQNGDGSGDAPLFSVANLVEPGHFDLHVMEESRYPGLTVFMVLPGPKPGVSGFADLLATARHLASVLEAELLDENGSTMTRQTARHIREGIIEFEHQLVHLEADGHRNLA